MTTPTNESSRRGMKGHVTRWINNIQQYNNVQMDLTVHNLVLGAESNLRNMYNKYKRISEGVARDMEQAGATQEQFQAEIDSQIQVEEDVGDALMIVKRKREEFKEIQDAEERTRQKADQDAIRAQDKSDQDAIRAQDKADQDAIRAQEKIDQDAARAQEIIIRQQEFQDQQNLFRQLIAAIPAAAAPGAPAAPAAVTSTKLPKRQIKPFKMDVLEWTSFWEGYNAAVHESAIPAVQKFGYLKDYLKGEAQLCVENLELTDANYTVAMTLLKAMYGKPDVLIEAHTQKLDTLQPVRDIADTAALRCFQLTIQSHINALETLGVARTSHGCLLGSSILLSIPLKLQAEWAKSATKKVTDIDQVLKFIEEQVEAAERLSRLRATTPKPAQNSQQPAKARQLQHQQLPSSESAANRFHKQNTQAKQEEMAAHHHQGEKRQHHLQESQCCHACSARRCIGLRIAQWS
jgi:hypothetical protein